jgi:hypothetical protein
MHEVNYDAEKIKLGIEIIDHFKETLDKFDDKSDIDTIDKETLDAINKEFQECCSQKLNILRTIKDFSQKLLKQVEEITFPSLEHYLSSRYTFSVGKMVCEYCNFIAKNQQALSAHYRGCAIRKQMFASHNSEEDETLQTPVENIQISPSTKPVKQKKTNLIVKTKKTN